MQILALKPGILPVNKVVKSFTAYYKAGGLMELPALVRHFVGLNSCKQMVTTEVIRELCDNYQLNAMLKTSVAPVEILVMKWTGLT